MSGNLPPADVQEAARKVQAYLDGENARPKSADEIAAMSPRDRLDYTRARSAANKMPDWKDPRAPA